MRKKPAVIAKGNCGIPVYVDEKVHYHGISELMANYAILARDLGVKIIGGCYRISPEHVRVMAQALNHTPLASPATLAEIEAKLGKPREDLPDRAEDGQSRRRRRGWRG